MTLEASTVQTPSGIPFYIERSPRRVQDPASSDNVDGWQGANAATFKLLRALESLRDLRVVLNDLLVQPQPREDRRRIKRVATPLYSFACAVRDICNEVLTNPDAYGGRVSSECKATVIGYRDEILRVIPLCGDSPLRTVRNKIDAHVDECTVMNPAQYWTHVDLSQFIDWIACSLIHFGKLLCLDLYGWTCESSHPDIFRLMSVDGTLVDFLMVEQKPSMIVAITQTTSPKVAIADELNAVITMHNALLEFSPTHCVS